MNYVIIYKWIVILYDNMTLYKEMSSDDNMISWYDNMMIRWYWDH